MFRFRIPSLEYGLSHPHPKGHWFLLATIIVLLLTLPVLILVNVATLGYNLVPSLQPRFQSNDTYLNSWWGTRTLPHLLRPKAPSCQPKDLGRGDAFRLSGSLFDYNVMSTWNTTDGLKEVGIQDQKRVEYRGESFANCFVNRAQYDYSLGDQTQSVTIGVLCPGYAAYPIEISMQTSATFAWELSKDFIGQYYGPGLALNISTTNASDYRKVALAVLEVISTDALTIMRKQHLSNQPLSTRVVFDVDPDTAEPIPQAATLTYANGTQPDPYPEEARIYEVTVYNLVAVVLDAVNLDLGNYRTPNAFRNATRIRVVVQPNLAPADLNISSTDWAEGSQTWYYGKLPPSYRTWAEALRDGHPVTLNNLTGIPNESVMTTTYLCPGYQIKPLSSLLASVFVGSATMTLSVWSAWMVFTTFLARQITPPQVICYCNDCELRRANEVEEAQRRAANPPPVQPGIFGRLVARVRGPKPATSTPSPANAEGAGVDRLDYNQSPQSGRPTHSLEAKRPSGLDSSVKVEWEA